MNEIEQVKTEQIVKCFALDLTANKTAEILGIERKANSDLAELYEKDEDDHDRK